MRKMIGILVGFCAAVALALAARLRHAKRVATPRRPFGWAERRIVSYAALVVGMLAFAGSLWAGSPAQVAGSVPTNGAAFTVPASGSMAYKLQAVVFSAGAVSTSAVHTVSLVQGSLTNQIGTKTVAATDCMLTVSNAPWQFAGDKVRITTTATTNYTVVLVGETAN